MINTIEEYNTTKAQVSEMLNNRDNLSEQEMIALREMSADLYLWEYDHAQTGGGGGDEFETGDPDAA